MVLRFDAGLAGLSAERFVSDILVGRFAVAGVAIGFDFHFGLNRAGSPDYLAAQGARLGFRLVELSRDFKGTPEEDELVEITPKSVRLRKVLLKESDRKKYARQQG